MIKTSIFLCCLFWLTTPALGLDFRFVKKEYSPDEQVYATANASGRIGVESDLARQSFSHTIRGNSPIPLGKVRQVGLYIVRFYIGNKVKTFCLVFTLASSHRYALEVVDLSDQALRPNNKQNYLIVKFFKGMNKARIVKAIERTYRTWIGKNVVSLSTTAIVCTSAIVVPSQSVTCGLSSLGHAVDYSFEVLAEIATIMREEGAVTEKERSWLHSLFIGGKTGTKMLLSADKIGKMLELISGAFNIIVDKPEARIVFKLSMDEAKKIRVLLKIAQKR